jgi:PhzF family phenazine biosynthesis protein
MRLPIHSVDVFTDHRFGGNPAAVVPLESWLPDATLQAIAAENNLSETAFFVPDGDGYELRWFTPALEIDLCGHATLGTAFVLAHFIAPDRDRFVFRTRQAGTLTVTREGPLFVLDFPAWRPKPVAGDTAWTALLGAPVPQAVLATRDYVAVYADEDEVRALKPDYRALGQAIDKMVIATAPGRNGIDYVLRFFAPGHGIDEDPVTGSAQCTLIPYWAERLGKERLEGRQLSARGGALTCALAGERVRIGGQGVSYLEGTITI